jgi:hypothetical protein
MEAKQRILETDFSRRPQATPARTQNDANDAQNDAKRFLTSALPQVVSQDIVFSFNNTSNLAKSKSGCSGGSLGN